MFKEQNFVGKKLIVRFVDSSKLKTDGTPYIELPKDKSFFPAPTSLQQQASKPKQEPSSEDSFALAGDDDDLPF
jgi:hypothetical protein